MRVHAGDVLGISHIEADKDAGSVVAFASTEDNPTNVSPTQLSSVIYEDSFDDPIPAGKTVSGTSQAERILPAINVLTREGNQMAHISVRGTTHNRYLRVTF